MTLNTDSIILHISDITSNSYDIILIITYVISYMNDITVDMYDITVDTYGIIFTIN